METLADKYFRYLTNMTRKVQILFGLKIVGPRAIILNAENQILLVKHVYAPYWYLPGGAAQKGESAKFALLRELKEEVGLTINEEPQLLGIYHKNNRGVDDYPVIYIIKNFTLGDTHTSEIEEIRWFNFNELPDTVSFGTKRRLTEYFNQVPPQGNW